MIIDQEFKSLIPPLSTDEYRQLEENILLDGVRDSVTYWDNNGDHILIDGHNRWEIAKKHNLPINERRMTFPDREAVIQWIILNQFGRRNLSAYDRGVLALKLKPVIAEEAKKNQIDAGGAVHQKSDKAVNTNKELAQVAGVSHDTIHKVETIQERGTPELQDACKKGDLSVNAAYNMIRAAELESRNQREAKELREAKQRHEDFKEQKDDGVINIADARQDQEDSKLIFNDFNETLISFNRNYHAINRLIVDDELKDRLRGADHYELRELYDRCRNWHSMTIQLLRSIEEVIHEK